MKRRLTHWYNSLPFASYVVMRCLAPEALGGHAIKVYAQPPYCAGIAWVPFLLFFGLAKHYLVGKTAWERMLYWEDCRLMLCEALILMLAALLGSAAFLNAVGLLYSLAWGYQVWLVLRSLMLDARNEVSDAQTSAHKHP